MARALEVEEGIEAEHKGNSHLQAISSDWRGNKKNYRGPQHEVSVADRDPYDKSVQASFTKPRKRAARPPRGRLGNRGGAHQRLCERGIRPLCQTPRSAPIVSPMDSKNQQTPEHRVIVHAARTRCGCGSPPSPPSYIGVHTSISSGNHAVNPCRSATRPSSSAPSVSSQCRRPNLRLLSLRFDRRYTRCPMR